MLTSRNWPTTLTIIFYLMVAVIIASLQIMTRPGSYANRLGIEALSFLPFWVLILATTNLILVFKGKTRHKSSAIIHLVVGISLLILFSNFA